MKLKWENVRERTLEMCYLHLKVVLIGTTIIMPMGLETLPRASYKLLSASF